MDMATILDELGGVATRAELLRHVTHSQLDQAVARGGVIRLARGRYGLRRNPAVESAAFAVSGVISHASAAEWYGWPLKHRPERHIATVPRHRTVTEDQRGAVDVRYADLTAAEINGPVTSPTRTVIDCSRTMPFDEALCVADSALRRGHVTRPDLAAAAAAAPRTGRRRAQRLVDAADGRAANAFESVVRALSLDVPGLTLEPQVRIAPALTPDLVDRRARIAVECDSWTFHAEQSAFHRDLRRYNTVQLDGWLLLRFDRDHAWAEPDYVRSTLTEAAAARSRSDRLAVGQAVARRPA